MTLVVYILPVGTFPCDWMEECVEVALVFLLGKPCLCSYLLSKAYGGEPWTAWTAKSETISITLLLKWAEVFE